MGVLTIAYPGTFDRIADHPDHQNLLYTGTNHLLAQPLHLPTVGHHALLVADPLIWKDLPD